jgi:hypothetical protein
MALHFLEHGFEVSDCNETSIKHEIELFENGGELYIRIWKGGIKMNKPVCGRLTADQAQALAEAAGRLAGRIAN